MRQAGSVRLDGDSIINKMSADDSDAHVLSDGFGDNAKQQLRELIRQNYNHPSVIVWGLFNELYQMTNEIFGLYSELYEIACEEDDTRLKTFADNQFYGRFLELPADVVGYNRYFGWYKEAGSAENFGEWLDLYHNKKEKTPCLPFRIRRRWGNFAAQGQCRLGKAT